METQNTVTKYLMNETSNKMTILEEKLGSRSDALSLLAKEYSQRWPNLEESEGLEYVEKEVIEGATEDKSSLVDTLERCIIENLRLKHTITTIGSEYNKELRKNKAES